ncbi:MAG: twin-arginine translocase subunit TatB [Betaproteobacteria bacterium]|nr:twin-arginine translocase subunit TatB [Betaproteobacteria bacterium]
MFDIAFSELVVIAIVALLVIGPEKLPKVARTLGAVMGRMQKYMAQIKEEVNREARFAELQQLQQEIKQTSDVTQQQIKSATSDLERDLLDEDAVSPRHEAGPISTLAKD